MELFTYNSGGARIRGESYGPCPETPCGGTVVIAHGADGVTDDLGGPWASSMRSLAQAFAANGLTALIPYYLEKTATSPGNPVLQSMFGHRAAWQQALADAVALAETDRVALVGFSLGGHLSLRLRGVVPVVVEFFAPLLDGIGPLPPTGAHCQVQIHHGEADGLVDITNAERIAHLLEEEGAEVDVWRYEDAGHGFGGRKAGDAAALKASMTRAVEFTTACLARNLTR